MENNKTDLLRILKSEVFSEPTTSAHRDVVIKYISEVARVASGLSGEDRRGSVGHGLAMDIAGALAFQGARGVRGEDWITEDAEPFLYEVMAIAGRLDADPSSEQDWELLLKLIG